MNNAARWDKWLHKHCHPPCTECDDLVSNEKLPKKFGYLKKREGNCCYLYIMGFHYEEES